MAFLSEPIPMIAHICTMVNIILRWAITNSISIQQFTRRYFFLWGQIFLFLRKQMSTGKTFFSYFFGQLGIYKKLDICRLEDIFLLLLGQFNKDQETFFFFFCDNEALTRIYFSSSFVTIRRRHVDICLLLLGQLDADKQTFSHFQTQTSRHFSTSFGTIRQTYETFFFFFFWDNQTQTRIYFSSCFGTLDIGKQIFVFFFWDNQTQTRRHFSSSFGTIRQRQGDIFPLIL